MARIQTIGLMLMTIVLAGITVFIGYNLATRDQSAQDSAAEGPSKAVEPDPDSEPDTIPDPIEFDSSKTPSLPGYDPTEETQSTGTTQTNSDTTSTGTVGSNVSTPPTDNLVIDDDNADYIGPSTDNTPTTTTTTTTSTTTSSTTDSSTSTQSSVGILPKTALNKSNLIKISLGFAITAVGVSLYLLTNKKTNKEKKHF